MERAPEHSRRSVRGPRRTLAAARCARLVSAAYMVQMENDVYTQIGLVMLHRSGRQEFNSDRRVRQRGVRTRQALVDAALDGARLRFRPS